MPLVNQSISVDCVVFGFNEKDLKVLLINRTYTKNTRTHFDMKLPGRMIFENESLTVSAHKTLWEIAGLDNIYLKQLYVFSNPDRLSKEDLGWINKFYGIHSDRVVTVAYYGLIKLDNEIIGKSTSFGCQWVEINEIKQLAMDHKDILSMALNTLCKEINQSDIAFHLLPKRFTLKQLHTLFCAVLGVDIDSRNFRKKVLSKGFIIPTGKKEIAVSHKPAEYYCFNKKLYEKAFEERKKNKSFINWYY